MGIVTIPLSNFGMFSGKVNCCHIWRERPLGRSEQFDHGNRHQGIG